MYSELSWFAVQLALGGIPLEQAEEETQAMQDELSLRPHLRNPQVFWNVALHQALVQVDIQSLNPELAAEQMAEELLEIASGVLLEVEEVFVNILDVQLSPN